MMKIKKEQTYQQKKNAVCVVLYDITGETLDPEARLEFEGFAQEVAQRHPNVLLSVVTT